jgi:hypothetical protein
MKFDPAIHTKAFLLSHPGTALELAKHSNEFSVSPLAQDLNLLCISDSEGYKIAHLLAEYQPQWLGTEAAQNYDVLRLANKYGSTVAHTLAIYQPQWLNSDACKNFDVLQWGGSECYKIAHLLAEYQPQWLDSEAAQNYDVLRLANKYGSTVAHALARHQPQWLNSDASKNGDVLQWADTDGTSVAHSLAKYQPQWLESEAAQNFEVLRMSFKSGWTVAHVLANYQSEWLRSEAAQNLEVLRLATNQGTTVALCLVRYQPNSIHLESLFHKKILCMEYEGQMLAEFISQKYGKTQGLDTATMAMKLIEQGAAYQHSTPMTIKVGDTLIKQGVLLLHDCYEPIVAFKQLQALYSTFAHNVAKIKRTDEQKSLSKWNDMLGKAENLLRQHLTKHPELFDREHTTDIFCEPGDDLLRKIMAERTINTTLSDVFQTEHEPPISEQGLY